MARELEDLQKELSLRKTGDIAHADELIQDARVIIIDSQKYDNRVEYIKHKEQGDSVFVLVKDESGSKMWADMLTLACQGMDGNKRPVGKADLSGDALTPLAN